MANPNPRHPEAAESPVATGTSTVVVACKLPQGFRARLFKKGEMRTTTPAGVVQSITQFQPTGAEYIFKGPQHGQNEGPRVLTASGFALTVGVPADFWDAWLDQHKEHDLVKSGLIFAFERRNDAVACAKEHKGIKTGLERIDPSKPVVHGRIKIEADANSPVKIGKLDTDIED